MRSLMFFTAFIFIATLGFSCGAGMTIAGGDVQRNVHILSHNVTVQPATTSGDGFFAGILFAIGALTLIAAGASWMKE